MGVEIVVNIEREEVVDPNDISANGVFSFRCQSPFDIEQVAIDRRLLGLDGAEPAPFTAGEKAVVATRLRNLGFLTDNEVEALGGRILERKKME